MWFSRGRVVALALAALAALTLTGCATWKTSKLPVDQTIAAKHPRIVRVTLADKRRVHMTYPVIERDTLSGFMGMRSQDSLHLASQPDRYARVAVPLSDIRQLEWQGISASKTTLLVIGIGATVALVAGMIALSNSSFGPTFDSSGGSGDGYGYSCPRLYSWDGAEWRIDSGTYGGAILKPLARTDVDNLEHATATNGRIEVRMTDEANETEFVDAVSLVAVDHAPGTGVAPDARGRIHSYGPPSSPLSARDFDGADALSRVREADEKSWESGLRPRDPANEAELRDGLVLSFAKPRDGQAVLVMTGHNTPWAAHLVGQLVQAHGSEEPAWQREAETHPAEARAAMERMLIEGMIEVSVEEEGGWKRAGLFWEAGPEVEKTQALPLDLSRVRAETVRVRLSSIPSFWLIDQVALAPASTAPVFTQEVGLAAATDSTGRDLVPVLSTIDDQTYRMERGNAALLSFAAPAWRPGCERTYLARTSGWYRLGCDTTRTPDHQVLARLATEPGAAARIAVERGNQALQVAQEMLR